MSQFLNLKCNPTLGVCAGGSEGVCDGPEWPGLLFEDWERLQPPCDPDWKSGGINRSSIDSCLYFLFQTNFTYFNQILKLCFLQTQVIVADLLTVASSYRRLNQIIPHCAALFKRSD